jgi:hypothetical protein
MTMPGFEPTFGSGSVRTVSSRGVSRLPFTGAGLTAAERLAERLRPAQILVVAAVEHRRVAPHVADLRDAGNCVEELPRLARERRRAHLRRAACLSSALNTTSSSSTRICPSSGSSWPNSDRRRRWPPSMPERRSARPGSGFSGSRRRGSVVILGIDRLAVADRAELIVDEPADLVVVEADHHPLVIAPRQIIEVFGFGLAPAGLAVEADPEHAARNLAQLRQQLGRDVELLVDEQVVHPIVDVGRVEVGDDAGPGAAAVLSAPDSGRRAAARI